MDMRTSEATTPKEVEGTVFAILIAISISHLLNDTIQSLLMGIYPLLRDSFALSYAQIGLISFTFLVTASILQPLVGTLTDRWPQPYSLMIGMGFTFAGLLLLAFAPSYHVVLLSAGMIGIGSAIFHPESSRIARLASGGRHGFAQAVFQVGGSAGTAIGPLMGALIVVPYGQRSIVWFSVVAIVALILLGKVSAWYQRVHFESGGRKAKRRTVADNNLSRARVIGALAALGALTFSKFFYIESFRSYYMFFLIEKFEVTIQTAQIFLFVQLFAIAGGALVGGILGDRFGRKRVIWASILGALPLTLILPHVGLVTTVALTIPIGMIIASAFPAIIVFAQELIPNRTGMVSGLFFGLAFGMGGLGAAALGKLADHTDIEFVYLVCSFLPAIGLLTVFLPNIEARQPAVAGA
jgi:FSR family fosmidomycin resistance protein-like MFS transporter